MIIYQRFNTNEVLKVLQSNRVFSPDICVMCYKRGETTPTYSSIVRQCETSWKLWTSLINWFGLSWVAPHTVESFMRLSFVVKGLGRWQNHYGELFLLVYGAYGLRETAEHFTTDTPHSMSYRRGQRSWPPYEPKLTRIILFFSFLKYTRTILI